MFLISFSSNMAKIPATSDLRLQSIASRGRIGRGKVAKDESEKEICARVKSVAEITRLQSSRVVQPVRN